MLETLNWQAAATMFTGGVALFIYWRSQINERNRRNEQYKWEGQRDDRTYWNNKEIQLRQIQYEKELKAKQDFDNQFLVNGIMKYSENIRIVSNHTRHRASEADIAIAAQNATEAAHNLSLLHDGPMLMMINELRYRSFSISEMSGDDVVLYLHIEMNFRNALKPILYAIMHYQPALRDAIAKARVDATLQAAFNDLHEATNSYAGFIHIQVERETNKATEDEEEVNIIRSILALEPPIETPSSDSP